VVQLVRSEPPHPNPSPASGRGDNDGLTRAAREESVSPLPLAGEADARSAAGEGNGAKRHALTPSGLDHAAEPRRANQHPEAQLAYVASHCAKQYAWYSGGL